MTPNPHLRPKPTWTMAASRWMRAVSPRPTPKSPLCPRLLRRRCLGPCRQPLNHRRVTWRAASRRGALPSCKHQSPSGQGRLTNRQPDQGNGDWSGRSRSRCWAPAWWRVDWPVSSSGRGASRGERSQGTGGRLPCQGHRLCRQSSVWSHTTSSPRPRRHQATKRQPRRQSLAPVARFRPLRARLPWRRSLVPRSRRRPRRQTRRSSAPEARRQQLWAGESRAALANWSAFPLPASQSAPTCGSMAKNAAKHLCRSGSSPAPRTWCWFLLATPRPSLM